MFSIRIAKYTKPNIVLSIAGNDGAKKYWPHNPNIFRNTLWPWTFVNGGGYDTITGLLSTKILIKNNPPYCEKEIL